MGIDDLKSSGFFIDFLGLADVCLVKQLTKHFYGA